MIQITGLVKSFGESEALRGVTFTARAGEVTGYLGANGAGKSTTLKIIAGLLVPSEGQVVVMGHDVAASPLEVKRRIGYVPESGALYTSLTPNEYLSLVAELHRMDRALAAERIGQLLGAFDVAEAADRQIETLSKGMRQKVLIAGALIHDPEVLLLDEPLNGLDLNAVLALRRIIESLTARGNTVLYSSHILEVVERMASRVVVIDHGKVVADDATARLLSADPKGTLESVFLSLAGSPGSEAGVREFLEGLGRRGGAEAARSGARP